MKLFYSPTSPFVRKVMACAVHGDIDAQIEKLSTSPWNSPPELLAHNPLSKVPCLVTDDGLALFDSPVICEYVDFRGRGDLFPTGAARFRALKQQALADGLTDAAILRRRDAANPPDPARTANIDRQRQIMQRALDFLEQHPPAEHVDIGAISVGCALGYLDLRFAEEPWRDSHPRLAAWYAGMAERPPLAKTAPPPA